MESLIRPATILASPKPGSCRALHALAAYAFRLLFISSACASSLTAQWVQTNGPGGGHVYSIYAAGPLLLAGTYGGPAISTNGGASWAPVSSGILNRYVYSFTGAGPGILAGTDQGIYLSVDGGMNWAESDSGLGAKSVRAFQTMGARLYAGTLGGGVFLSTNAGAGWTAVDSALTYRDVHSLL